MRPFLLGLALFLAAGAAVAQSPDSQLKDVGIDQHLNAQVPLDLAFTDETGKAVHLRDYFGDKPVILVLAYYRCPMLCTLVLNGLGDSLAKLNFTIGKEFRVVTVSFDPREKPPLAAEKKAHYLARYGRPEAVEGWHFLTGEEESIRQLAAAVGFRYVYDAAHDQYIHASGIMIATPEGKLSRYFYGVEYPPRDLRLGLVEASAHQIASPADEVLLYCFHYDPQTGLYTASVMNFVRLGGSLTVLAVAGIVSALLVARRKPRGAGP